MTEKGKAFRAGVEGGRFGRLFAVCASTVSARFLRNGSLALPIIAILLAGCRPHDFPQYPPNYREYAYVTNGESGTVTVLDVVNVRLDREIQVGADPVAVAPSPTRNEVYVVVAGSPGGQGTLAVINAESNQIAAAIPLHRQPVSVSVDAEGKLAYVANSGSNSVSVVDLVARREVALIGTGEQPAEANLSPDGRTLVVPNRGGNSVTIVGIAARPLDDRVRAIFTGCPGAADAVILPDSSKTFVACSAGRQIMAIALADSKFHTGAPDHLEALMDVGSAPVDLALKPDGGELFVSNSLSDTISEVVTTTDDVGGAYLMGDTPVNGIVSADNSLLYVANVRSQAVTVYGIDDGRRIAGPGIHVGDGPSAMAFSAEGHLLFVVDSRSGDVAVVRTSTQSPFTMLPTGRGPNAIAVKAFKVQ
ncbi:MAG TPA: YncE family protein [Terracidiphilus sp.]|jgi:YVTN family beta-propeller protein|nr:YncE family protein [Terracidiphilus sp.]